MRYYLLAIGIVFSAFTQQGYSAPAQPPSTPGGSSYETGELSQAYDTAQSADFAFVGTPSSERVVPIPSVIGPAVHEGILAQYLVPTQNVASPSDNIALVQYSAALPAEDAAAVIPASWSSGCSDPNCGGSTNFSCYDYFVFGEFLYLRPRDADIAYAVPIDGPIAANVPRIPVGPTASVDPNYEPAFRFGFGASICDCCGLTATYTHFESATTDAVSVNPPLLLHPLVIHPTTVNAADDVLAASARLDIEMDIVDIDYLGLIFERPSGKVYFLIGARYGRLEQDFASQFNFNTVTDVTSNVRFNGGGIRTGLIGLSGCFFCPGMHFYGKGTASFLGGVVKARYFQGDAFDPVVVDASWEGGRVITILDLEVGVGWISPCGRYRVTGGYLFNSWTNMLTLDEFISASQNNTFNAIGDNRAFDGVTFDGLTFRAEIRF